MKSEIGFIGLGRLGLPIATNLMDSGYTLAVYNRTQSKASGLVKRGARLACRPSEAVSPGGIVMSIVWDSAALESVVTSPGFLEGLGPGGIHVSMSTVSPVTSRKLAQLHKEHGVSFVEATVFGRPAQAPPRQLNVATSGPQAAKELVLPIIKAMGAQNIYDFGENAGAAAIVKLTGNFMIVSAVRTMVEAYSMAEKNGVDPGLVAHMLTNTLFSAPIYKNYAAMYLNHPDFLNMFYSDNIFLKDVELFMNAAKSAESAYSTSSYIYEDLLKIHAGMSQKG